MFHLRPDRIDAAIHAGLEVNPSAILDTWVDARITAHWNAGTSLYDTATIEHRLSAPGDSGAWTQDIVASSVPWAADASDWVVQVQVHEIVGGYIDDISLVVPEPSSIVLLGLGGLAGLAMLRRRRRSP